MSDLARRMINLLACRTTLPGRAIRAKRTAFRRLLAHWPPNASRFIAEFRACPVAPYGVEGQHRYGPPCCVGPKQPRRKPASGQIILQNAVDLLPFAAPLPRPPDQLIARESPGWSPARRPCAMLRRPASWRNSSLPPYWKGSSNCVSIPGRGCSFSGSLIAMNLYSGFFLLRPIHSGTKFTSAHC